MNEKRDVEGLYNRYRQVPLYLIGMFCLMTVFMYFVGIGAGVIATIPEDECFVPRQICGICHGARQDAEGAHKGVSGSVRIA